MSKRVAAVVITILGIAVIVLSGAAIAEWQENSDLRNQLRVARADMNSVTARLAEKNKEITKLQWWDAREISRSGLAELSDAEMEYTFRALLRQEYRFNYASVEREVNRVQELIEKTTETIKDYRAENDRAAAEEEDKFLHQLEAEKVYWSVILRVLDRIIETNGSC